MLLAVIALQALILLGLAILLTRKAVVAAAPDQRLAELPDRIVALGARADATEAALRGGLSDARTQAELANRSLREEVTGSINQLSKALNDGLGSFRADNKSDAFALRDEVHRELGAVKDRLTTFSADQAKSNADTRDAMNARLVDLREAQNARLIELREAQTTHLGKLNTDNAAKLEEMRATVDEKLQATLHTRLTESFGQVSDQLTKVHSGLGEMKELATGVSDLKKVFSNVKSRGVVGEFQLGMQLEQMFSREQYLVNAKIKPGSNESVEFALKIPDGDDCVLLPIDAKFPREDWERLEHAYEHGTVDEQAKAGVAFERAIRTEGKRICEKYIDPPKTLPFGIMFLPTEALYAEVMRRPGLHTELQSSCHVTVAGPSSFMAILTSFQMGFRTLAIQKKGNEVWNVLGRVKKEFSNFELLMNKVERNVTTVQNTLNEIGTRTRVINKNLHNVSELNAPDEPTPSGLLSFESGIAPRLAATTDDEDSVDHSEQRRLI